MTRRTRSHAQHSDAPPPATEPIPGQGGQQDVNNLHVEEVPEHCPGKEPMTVALDNGFDLGDLMRRTERVEDVIGVVQTMVKETELVPSPSHRTRNLTLSNYGNTCSTNPWPLSWRK